MARTKGAGKLAPKKEWRKILYGSREYPDNYTHSSFLHELRKNVHVYSVSFREAVLGAGRLYWDCPWIFVVSVPNYFAIFVAVGFASSPILKTLTETISTDTIYAMTVFMMLIHLIFKDYGVSAAVVSSSLSFNAAIFGSICLASRLASSFHAFVLLSLSVEAFVLLPLLMVQMGQSVCVLLLIIFVTVGALWSLSPPMTIFFILLVAFVNLICPIRFLKWQVYKENIYGPWDEAVVEDADNILS